MYVGGVRSIKESKMIILWMIWIDVWEYVKYRKWNKLRKCNECYYVYGIEYGKFVMWKGDKKKCWLCDECLRSKWCKGWRIR